MDYQIKPDTLNKIKWVGHNLKLTCQSTLPFSVQVYFIAKQIPLERIPLKASTSFPPFFQHKKRVLVLLCQLASGEVFGPDQPIALKLLGSERSLQALEGMSLNYCCAIYGPVCISFKQYI